MANKILIIDDEPVFITPIIDILELEDIDRNDVIYCSQISEAFSALEAQKGNIACISLDMLIADPLQILKGESDINGLKALRQIRELYPAVPIVCFTILSEKEGGIREAVSKYSTKFISKTDADSVEKLLTFFKKYYGKY